MTARITPEEWAGTPALRLQDEVVSLLVAPALGGRVISLLDRRSGREWLVQGAPPSHEERAAWGTEEAVFSGRQSWGWDECLPTVSPCADPLAPDAAPLRDHGDQWGRATSWHAGDADASMAVSWEGSRWPYHLSRTIRLEGGGRLLAEYELTSRASERLPILWSMHPVLKLEPGTRIDIPGAQQARLTWVNGLPMSPRERVGWPVAVLDDGVSIDLATVRGEESWAAKLYAAGPPVVRAVCPDDSSLEMAWHRDLAPSVGVWLSFGGWPPEGPPRQQVALEPTTSPDDHLLDALSHARALWLEPGERRTWWVRLALGPPG